MKKQTLIIIIVLAVIVYIFSLITIIGLVRKSSFISSNTIAVIEVEGIIYDSKSIVRQLKNYTKNPLIKGILIRIDSPGGGVAASQEIYTEVKNAKAKGKKIVVSMGAVAASGGYYIACPADIIVANPGTLTGSIGVIMQFPIVDELLKKVGVRFETVKSREHKDIGSPFRTLTDKERKLLDEMTTDIYNQFIEAIEQNRNLPREKILPYADGRIFSGQQALSYGLVDSLGSYEDAIKITANLCGITKEPQIIKERPRFSLLNRIVSRSLNRLLLPIPLYLYR
ncbi:MAG: signal peptide peptidase SppA [Candidatus Latescibacteria bacterium]|nr:signal peptide peptidase SppA [Candidatus Latescibacterota bacterium]